MLWYTHERRLTTVVLAHPVSDLGLCLDMSLTLKLFNQFVVKDGTNSYLTKIFFRNLIVNFLDSSLNRLFIFFPFVWVLLFLIWHIVLFPLGLSVSDLRFGRGRGGSRSGGVFAVGDVVRHPLLARGFRTAAAAVQLACIRKNFNYRQSWRVMSLAGGLGKVITRERHL